MFSLYVKLILVREKGNWIKIWSSSPREAVSSEL